MTLLDGGADVNSVRAADHMSPLLVAAINGQFDLAVKLLERGADPNLTADSGLTPLFGTLSREWYPAAPTPGPMDHMYQETTYLELMVSLLLAGADPNARLEYNDWVTELGASNLRLDWVGGTAFLRAAHSAGPGRHDALGQVRSRPPHRIDEAGEGVPHRHLGGNRQEGHRHLGAPAGSSRRTPGPGRCTWLPATVGVRTYHVANVHRYVPDGWLPAVQYLVEEHGFDVNLPDYYGDTALHNAAARGDNELILYLVEQGADVSAVNRQWQTTLDMANSPEQRTRPFRETIKLLESLGAKNNHRCVTC